MQKTLRIVYDIHGKYEHFKRLLVDNLIQLGDFGFHIAHELFKHERTNNQYVLFGNHDDYTKVYDEHSLYDITTIDTGNYAILCIRGAWSIDKIYRTEGKDWWNEEELTYKQMQNATDIIVKWKEELEEKKEIIIISHDCPMFVKKELFGYENKTITNQFLEHVQEIVKPSLWFFGHYHTDVTYFSNDTFFECKGELGYTDLEIDKFEVTKYKL